MTKKKRFQAVRIEGAAKYSENKFTYKTLRRSPLNPWGTKLLVTRMIFDLNNGLILKRNSIFVFKRLCEYHTCNELEKNRIINEQCKL